MSRAAVEFYGANRGAEGPRAGDIILTHGDHFFSRLIRFGQRLRYDKPWWTYNHAALVIDDVGTIVEAMSDGVVAGSLGEYRRRDYLYVRIEAAQADRDQIVAFAQNVAKAKWRYGWLTIVSAVLTLATGSKLVFGKSGTAICSGFVSQALVRAGYIFPKNPDGMLPADLAQFFLGANDGLGG